MVFSPGLGHDGTGRENIIYERHDLVKYNNAATRIEGYEADVVK